MVEVTDPNVIARSGEKFHPIVVPSSDLAAPISGTVFQIIAGNFLSPWQRRSDRIIGPSQLDRSETTSAPINTEGI
ncbi:hypothetical protein [Rhizobium multihospitium]|uniref:hypothetical protein n=1 Tax=Rhizobium multihospitium TaxID=410764 RepID=UPI000B87F042|nr:hypothetical protein [Rhizobium multihospitium]